MHLLILLDLFLVRFLICLCVSFLTWFVWLILTPSSLPLSSTISHALSHSVGDEQVSLDLQVWAAKKTQVRRALLDYCGLDTKALLLMLGKLQLAICKQSIQWQGLQHKVHQARVQPLEEEHLRDGPEAVVSKQ